MYAMLPNMSSTLAGWSAPYTIKTVVNTTVDFENILVVTQRTIQAVVQPAQKDKLNTEQIDWSKRYIQIHTNTQLAKGEYIVYDGEDYKIIEDGDYELYGFCEVIAEQTKLPLIVSTPVVP